MRILSLIIRHLVRDVTIPVDDGIKSNRRARPVSKSD